MKKVEYKIYDTVCDEGISGDDSVPCFHCEKGIGADEGYFEISQCIKAKTIMWLYFHTRCFKQIAGVKYMLEDEL
jgi:hypothetical protein